MKYINLVKDILITFFSAIGVLWIIIQVFDFFSKNQIHWLKSNDAFLFVLFVSLAYSIFNNFPFKKIHVKISGTEVYLTLKYGDILQSNGHIAVSSSNFFNTSQAILSKKSVLAQIIETFFKGNSLGVDEGVSNSLANIEFKAVTVNRGKSKSYPVGTIASFDINRDKRIFLMAITKITEINGHENIESNISYIHKALNNLWDKAQREVDNGTLNIIPFGSGISKTFNRNVESILYIVQSFIDRSKKERLCSELVIYIKRNDICLNEYIQLKKIITFLA